MSNQQRKLGCGRGWLRNGAITLMTAAFVMMNLGEMNSAWGQAKPARKVSHDAKARWNRKVDFPADLVEKIKREDPGLDDWLRRWHASRKTFGMPEQNELKKLLEKTTLTPSDMWRMARQMDRGAAYIHAALWAGEAVQRLDKTAGMENNVTANMVKEVWNLRPFVEWWGDTEDMGAWGRVMLRFPGNMTTADQRVAARLGIANEFHYNQQEDKVAATLAEMASSGDLSKAQSETQAEVEYFKAGLVADSGRLQEALEKYQEVEAMGGKYAVDTIHAQAMLHARLGQREEAFEKAAEWLEKRKKEFPRPEDHEAAYDTISMDIAQILEKKQSEP